MADLWFHAMVAMAHLGLRPEEVVAELARREGLSGLVEFAMRNNRASQSREQSED
jgi:phosphoribosyl-ATP pyrophosphohydrolase